MDQGTTTVSSTSERSPESEGTFASSVFTIQKLSKWKCELFGCGPQGLVYTPPEGQEPNWFWRKMQYLAFGHRWVKDK